MSDNRTRFGKKLDANSAKTPTGRMPHDKTKPGSAPLYDDKGKPLNRAARRARKKKGKQ